MAEEKTLPPPFVPQGVRKVRYDLTKAKTLLYGPPKIGKTTLAAQFPGVWFLATEEGQDYVECHEPTQIKAWNDDSGQSFLDLCMWIEQNKPTHFGDGTPIHTLAIDTGELLFKQCHDYMVQHLGVNDLSELPYGKGWNALSDEFSRVMAKISRWPYGFVFICHATEKEIKSGASKIDRIQPGIMTTGLKIMYALCDVILYANVREVPERDAKGDLTGRLVEERVLRCQPRNNLIAGDRTRQLPAEISMSYASLVSYFPDTPNYAAPKKEEPECASEGDYGFKAEEGEVAD